VTPSLVSGAAGGEAVATAPGDRSAEHRIALRLRGIAKTFPGVRALRGIDLDVAAGSVHALLGHNGCGKSTLVKVLAGVHSPDPGAQAVIDGEPLQLGHPDDAARRGLRFVHQELGIIPELSAVDNVGFVVGFARDRIGRIDWRRQAEITVALLHGFGFELDPWRPLAELSPPQRTAVAIVRAVAGWQRGRGVLVLDEPTAALAAQEVDELFRLIRDVSATGTAVLLVSHRLDEVMAVADHATVMRAGETVWDGPLSEQTTAGLVTLIAGTGDQQLDHEPRREGTRGAGSTRPVQLEVRRLTARYLRDVGFSVGRGEIVGVAGLLGSGRDELPYVLGGALTDGISGSIAVAGEELRERSIIAAQRLGIALVPADRALESIFEDFTTGENVSLAALPKLASGSMLALARERSFARAWLEAVGADASTVGRQISTLSGGNQQKAVLARWLSVTPRVLVLAEPTAGVDIGARLAIYNQLRGRAADGLAVVIASSDVEDLLACCDHVIVLRDGRIVAELAGTQMTKPAIVGAMEGLHSDNDQH
jgi:ribose transport system ATP-binding protein